MTYRVGIDPVARRQIDLFAVYLRDYNEDFAIEQIDRFDRILYANLAEAPLMWSYFPLTGAPYRGYLFRIGRRTQYWIIYTVDEDIRRPPSYRREERFKGRMLLETVAVARLWNWRRIRHSPGAGAGGAEVVAGGCIHVYGTLRGRAWRA